MISPARGEPARHLIVSSLLVYSGRISGALLGFLVSVVVARELGPEQYGLFSLFIVIAVIGANLFGEAFAAAIVRNYGLCIQRGISSASTVLKSALALRLAIGAPITIFVLAVSDWLARDVFRDAAYAMPISLGVAAAFGSAIWSFALTGFQASESFVAYALFTPTVNMLRALTVPVLFAFGYFTLEAVLNVHVVLFFVTGIFGCWLLRDRLRGGCVGRKEIRSQVEFSKWIALALVCLLLQAHLGVPVLSYLAGKESAGIYAAGANLLIIVDHLTAAIITVLYPMVSKLTTLADCRTFVRRSAWIFPLIGIAILPVLWIARPVVLIIYGPVYEQSAEALQILLIGYVTTLMAQPVSLVLLRLNRPQLWSLSAAISVIAWCAAALMLIPNGGVVGAAWATTVARACQALISVYLVWRVVYQRSGEDGGSLDTSSTGRL